MAAIELNQVRFAYAEAPERWVLNIPSWQVAEGEQLFVHGPSGGGKSTLLNLLSGMYPCQQGELSILGQRLDTLGARQRDKFRARHIGYVFQLFNLIPYLSAVDNILLAHHFSRKGNRQEAQQEAEGLLAALNLPASAWHQPTNHLSIGQQQRVAIARALINKPHILIADEPTSSLDQSNRDNFMAMLMSLASEYQITLLFVSHDMSLARYFSRVEALTDINQVRSC